MTKEIDCPYGDCKGKLKLLTFFSTDMGYVGLDENKKTDMFDCPVCKRTVSRTYTWQEVKVVGST